MLIIVALNYIASFPLAFLYDRSEGEREKLTTRPVIQNRRGKPGNEGSIEQHLWPLLISWSLL